MSVLKPQGQGLFKFCIKKYKGVTFHDTKALRLGKKDPIKVQISRFLSALMKVHPIPHASFETTRSRFIQILHHCSVFGQKEPIEFKFSDI